MEFEKIRAIISEQLDIDEDEITREAALEDLGADSLDLVDIVMGIEDEFRIEVTEEAAANFVSVGDIVDFVENN